jgi:hypothetical protein
MMFAIQFAFDRSAEACSQVGTPPAPGRACERARWSKIQNSALFALFVCPKNKNSNFRGATLIPMFDPWVKDVTPPKEEKSS